MQRLALFHSQTQLTVALGIACGAMSACVGKGELLAPLAPPAVRLVVPAEGAPGSNVTVTLVGANFVAGATSVSVAGDGVTVGEVHVSSDSELTAQLALATSAAQGPRPLSVETAGGRSGTIAFNVAANAPPPPPGIGSFTATPDSIAPGDSAVLAWSAIANATSCAIDQGIGSVACSGGSAVVRPVASTSYTLSATGTGGSTSAAATVRVSAPAGTHGSVTFAYTGAAQLFVVPRGVTTLTVDVAGAQGSGGAGGGSGGSGAEVTASIEVAAGDTVAVMVGGSNGFNGGGSANAGGAGGGASDVRLGGSGLADRVLVAAGGGGGGASGGSGGKGGAATGSAGGSVALGGSGGSGGSQSSGGGGGAGSPSGAAGALGGGGAGGSASSVGGGGGGGGYYGGGGGGAGGLLGGGGGGGGGSSYAVGSATSVTITAGGASGNGRVVITW